MERVVKIGTGILIIKDGKVLLHQRKSTHGDGEYETPGGHLEYMESFEECAKREAREECGIEIKNIRLLFVANLNHYKPKHYVHIELCADWESGEPQNLEPEKGDDWKWYDLENLPSPLFATEQNAIKSYKEGVKFYDLDFNQLPISSR